MGAVGDRAELTVRAKEAAAVGDRIGDGDLHPCQPAAPGVGGCARG